MKIIVHDNPMPAVRMTGRGKFVKPLAMAYVAYKKTHADEINLKLQALRKNVIAEGGMINIIVEEGEKIHFSTSDLFVKCRFFRKDHRGCDIDNLLKAAFDILQTAEVITNDTQIKEVWAKMEQGSDNPRFEMEIHEIN